MTGRSETPAAAAADWAEQTLEDRYGHYNAHLAGPLSGIVDGSIDIGADPAAYRTVRDRLVRELERDQRAQQTAIGVIAQCGRPDHDRGLRDEAGRLIRLAVNEHLRRAAPGVR